MALTNVRVIDGTGAPASEKQTIVIRDDRIAELGDAARITVPAGATVVDLAGRSVIPGLVMVHEHLYYPTGPGVYGQLGESFSRLYLAGGVTTMRTGGNMNGYMDLSLMRAIAAGQKAGPAIDATAPYMNGPNTFQQMRAVKTADEARRHVAYWAEQGATSVKAYMQISRARARRGAIEEAHKRGMKVTGHLCSVTYSEAADLGIDNLEHGFLAATDFVADKQADVCPGQGARTTDDRGARRERRAVYGAREEADRQAGRVDVNAHRLRNLHAGPPDAARARGAHAAAEAAVRADARARRAEQGLDLHQLFPKAMALERAFARAGGVLIAGTDPTGSGGVIPGFSNQRQIELLVDAGFTPLEAITIAHVERRAIPRTRIEHRKYCGRQAGRPRGAQRRPVHDDRRRAEGRDGVQAGGGLRSGEADRRGIRQGGLVVRRHTAAATKITKLTKITKENK